MWTVTAATKLKDTCSLEEFRQYIRKQRRHFANKGPCSQSHDFSSSHIWMWELDHKEAWVLKNWFWTVVLEKSWESLGQQGDSKGNQYLIFIGRTGAEVEVLILWPHDAKNQLTGKDLDSGKDWGQEKNGVTEDEMVGWHHWLNRHEFSKCLEMVKDRVTWHAAVLGVTKSRTWHSNGTTRYSGKNLSLVTT